MTHPVRTRCLFLFLLACMKYRTKEFAVVEAAEDEDVVMLGWSEAKAEAAAAASRLLLLLLLLLLLWWWFPCCLLW